MGWFSKKSERSAESRSLISDADLDALSEERARRDIGRLIESGVPITPELVRAMAERSAREDAVEIRRRSR